MSNKNTTLVGKENEINWGEEREMERIGFVDD